MSGDLRQQVVIELQGARIATRWLKLKLKKILRHLDVRSGDWSISIVGDREMINLHKKTMGLATITDVLTFDLRDHPKSKKIALDTVICLDEAKRRAAEFGHTVRQELLLYCVHSLLHVTGFNDITPSGAKAMHAREDQLLVAAEVGPVYRGSMQNTKRQIRKTKTRYSAPGSKR